MKSIVLSLITFLILSCSNNKNNSTGLEIKSIEIIDPKDSLQNNAAKIKNVKKYLEQNKDLAIVKNYHFLNQDTLFISPKRHFSKKLNKRLNTTNGQLTLFPINYEVNKGEFARFKVTDKKLGLLESYILNFSFLNNEITSCEALIAFCKKDSLGKKKTTLFKTIHSKENYLIEQNLKSKNWH